MTRSQTANVNLFQSGLTVGLAGSRQPRVGIVCDLLQENWPSMDLAGDMLLEGLQKNHGDVIRAERLRPQYNRHFRLLKLVDTAERALNRYKRYPRWLSWQKQRFDVFHIVDHSYAHLVHSLPASQTVVTCHDTDGFRCLIEPPQTVRAHALQRVTRRVLSGLKNAACVVCDTAATAGELLAQGWTLPHKTSVVHLGVSPVFSPDGNPAVDGELEKRFNLSSAGARLLHVGSTIPRKRMDLVLRIFAAVKQSISDAILIRVGGPLSAEQKTLARALGVSASILELPFLSDEQLAAIYRRSCLLLLPSDREGFGFPLLEAMACGLPAVVSDIPALREVGGNAAVYCSPGNVREFIRCTITLLLAKRSGDRRHAGFLQARKFSWSRYAAEMVHIYQGVLSSQPPSSQFGLRLQSVLVHD